MVESDHSETEERNMVKLEPELDGPTRKRPRIEDSEDEEQELPTKKHRNSVGEESELLNKNNAEAVSNKNGDEYNAKEERHMTLDSKQNAELDMAKENVQKQKDKSAKQKDESESLLDKNNSIADENSIKVKIEKEDTKSEDSPTRMPVTNINAPIDEEEINQASDKESMEEVKTEKDDIDQSTDTEIVDGLELSVECASDKEEPSSESEDETNVKPRQKTIIVKVKPGESELECSSSEEEKSNVQEIIDTSKNKSEKKNAKRKGLRMNSGKMRSSESEDSQNNNSDEDYSPRTKKKIKRSPTKKQTKLAESKKRRSEGTKKNSLKKNTDAFDDENADVSSPERDVKVRNETEEDLLENESSASNSESKNSEDEKKSSKNTRERRSSSRSKDNKHIQTLKKYLNVAGIKVRSYNDIWANCKSNTAKVKRLKELLEKNGVSGRPTLEKCKRVKEKNEKMREISELDVSNIISEGRVTRARRNIDSDKKATFTSTPPRHREAHNTFKRIKTVVDSDSE